MPKNALIQRKISKSEPSRMWYCCKVEKTAVIRAGKFFVIYHEKNSNRYMTDLTSKLRR